MVKAGLCGLSCVAITYFYFFCMYCHYIDNCIVISQGWCGLRCVATYLNFYILSYFSCFYIVTVFSSLWSLVKENQCGWYRLVSTTLIFLFWFYLIFCVFVLSWYCNLHGQGWSMLSSFHHLKILFCRVFVCVLYPCIRYVMSWYCHLHDQGWSMWSRLHHLESLSLALGRWSQPGRWDNFVSMINED